MTSFYARKQECKDFFINSLAIAIFLAHLAEFQVQDLDWTETEGEECLKVQEQDECLLKHPPFLETDEDEVCAGGTSQTHPQLFWGL